MEINKICEQIVNDITTKVSIAEILLKTQLLASMVGVDNFSQWVTDEQNGYRDPLKVPDYRKLGCNVTASLTIPFHVGLTEVNVPVDAIQHKGVRQMLSTMYYDSAAVEAERLAATSENGRLRKPTPGMGYQYVQKLFPNAHVEAVYQDMSPYSFATLIETVKSKILSFILGMEKEGIIHLQLDTVKNTGVVSKVYYQTFNNSIVGNDGGIVTAKNIMLINDELSEQTVQKLQTIFSRLNVLIKEEQDPMLQEAAETLNNEIHTEKPKKSVIKRGLAIIKGLAMGVASNEIVTIINTALGVL